MSEFLIKSCNDYAFKKLMSVENARIGFLSAILNFDSMTLKNSYFKYLRKQIKNS